VTDPAWVPVGHWIAEDAWREPSLPTATFTTTRSSHRPSQLGTVHALSQSRHNSSAEWFTTRPRPGSVILHHRAIQPVLIREWSLTWTATPEPSG
jgi:hypothetical protein